MKLLQLKINLLNVVPAVWRRFVVPGELTLAELHAVIQTVMGWKNAHVHQFRVAGTKYSDPKFELGDDVLNERRAILGKLLITRGARLEYVCDSGDYWQHELVVEEVLVSDRRQDQPICLAGECACPPEDCGGPGGYEELLEALANPQHPEHHEMRVWAGRKFNPERFDLAAVSRRLKKRR
ncbi:MAG: plasmid pRiA4b ORF-3 family protein [Acidobacteriota bacterium]|nr:plasmid pRiA4b ORF-3 family protein [Acidobacteriota bacterium]